MSYCFNDETFWALPGGAPGPCESPAAAARRELFEETGLEVSEVRLLFVSDHTYRSGIGIDTGGPGGFYHELGLYFVGTRPAGELVCGDEPEHGNRNVIRSAAFVPFDEMPGIRFYPGHIVQPLLQAAKLSFESPPFYIEDRSLRDYIARPADRAPERTAPAAPFAASRNRRTVSGEPE